MAVVTFKLQGKPGSLLEINQSLKDIAAKVRKLDGCIETKVYQDSDDESIFFLVEEWQSQRHLDDHMKSDLFAALLGIEVLLVREPEIKFMDEN
jgi:quinol monooxygenase YgiN